MLRTLPRLAPRVIPRSELVHEHVIKVYPEPQVKQTPVSTLDLLLKKKAELGPDYPLNIRLEPPLPRHQLTRVSDDILKELKEYIKER
jgi:hypothetical protein